MISKRPVVTVLSVGLLVVGCFSPRLLDAPYREPIESQREFNDDFNNPVALGNRWRPISGWWEITESQLLQKLPWRSPLPGDFQMLYVNGMASGPYTVETRLSFLKEGDQGAGVLLRFQDQDNFYLLRVRHYPKWQDYVDLTQYVEGIRREDLRRMNLTVQPGEWYTLKAVDTGREIVAFLDGNEIFRYPTEDPAMGTVGLAVKTGRVSFDRFSAVLQEETESALERGPMPAPPVASQPDLGNPTEFESESDPGVSSEDFVGPLPEPVIAGQEIAPLGTVAKKEQWIELPAPPDRLFKPDLSSW